MKNHALLTSLVPVIVVTFSSLSGMNVTDGDSKESKSEVGIHLASAPQAIDFFGSINNQPRATIKLLEKVSDNTTLDRFLDQGVDHINNVMMFIDQYFKEIRETMGTGQLNESFNTFYAAAFDRYGENLDPKTCDSILRKLKTATTNQEIITTGTGFSTGLCLMFCCDGACCKLGCVITLLSIVYLYANEKQVPVDKND